MDNLPVKKNTPVKPSGQGAAKSHKKTVGSQFRKPRYEIDGKQKH